MWSNMLSRTMKYILNIVFIMLLFTSITTITNSQDTNYTTTTNTSFENNLSNDTAFSEKLNIFEWLGSLFGQATTEKPETLLEPVNCDTINCKCGLTNTRRRIVGGKETKVNQYPWMAALLYNGYFYCGGSLINDLYILTAAHCVYGFRKESISVVLLEHDRSDNEETIIKRIYVKNTIVHESYDRRTYDNDIALLKLKERVQMNDIMRPVCLPPSGRSFANQTGLVTGWGATSFGGEQSDALNEVQVPILSNKDCKKTGYDAKQITPNMLCAGYPEGKKDSCQGDSGGPLHIIEGSYHKIAGIVSWGEGCARPNYPGVYTRTNKYLTWIKIKTKDACYCSGDEEKI